MAQTKIEWSEKVWNVITGCTKVSSGCKNCYAEGIAKRFWGDRKFSDIIFHEDRLMQPYKWKKAQMIFVNSMSDLFHERIDFQTTKRIWHVMRDNPQHTFQILTKRLHLAFEFYEWMALSENERIDYENIWLGVSIENTKEIERLEWLQKIEVKTRFISFEPLLESIDLYQDCIERDIFWSNIHWAIIGCESGMNKRNCITNWVLDLAHDLHYLGIPTFIKQINIKGKVEKDITKFPDILKIRDYPILK